MKKHIIKTCRSIRAAIQRISCRVKCLVLAAAVMVLKPFTALAQALATTGYDAGTDALEDVATEIAKYVPYVVNICYALAGVVAIVGAISVYIAMNNGCFPMFLFERF